MRAEQSQGLRSKTIFVTISIIVVSILIDTTIVKVSVYIGGISGSSRDIAIYIIITLVLWDSAICTTKIHYNKRTFQKSNNDFNLQICICNSIPFAITSCNICSSNGFHFKLQLYLTEDSNMD